MTLLSAKRHSLKPQYFVFWFLLVCSLCSVQLACGVPTSSEPAQESGNLADASSAEHTSQEKSTSNEKQHSPEKQKEQSPIEQPVKEATQEASPEVQTQEPTIQEQSLEQPIQENAPEEPSKEKPKQPEVTPEAAPEPQPEPKPEKPVPPEMHPEPSLDAGTEKPDTNEPLPEPSPEEKSIPEPPMPEPEPVVPEKTPEPEPFEPEPTAPDKPMQEPLPEEPVKESTPEPQPESTKPEQSQPDVPPPVKITKRSVFFVGHSLINTIMPYMMGKMATSLKYNHSFAYQIINGANLKYNWSNSGKGQGKDARKEIATGKYDTLVITEAVPLDNHTKWSGTNDYAGRFYDLAVKNNKKAQVYLYETWHCINSGTPKGCKWDNGAKVAWRTRLKQDIKKWQGIVDAVNKKHAGKGPKMLLIPAGQALGNLVDAIQAKKVPGFTRKEQLFADDIHMNDAGNFFIALVHLAVIYKQNPAGVSTNIKGQWGQSFKTPSAQAAKVMAKIAWDTVRAYPQSGVK